MKEALQGIKQMADKLISMADSEAAIEELRVRFLGKKGELTAILKQMGGLGADERPIIGALANEVREAIDTDIRRRSKELADAV
ncbi:MAG: phenylalanine--tRNA ligase subunit alpha, partial [Oscillospiraceae bacterium]